MRIAHGAAIALGVMSWTGLGCVEVERPGGPTGPERPGARLGSPILHIAQPVQGQRFTRADFTRSPGVRLVATGDAPVDHSIAVEAYQNNHLLPFSGHVIRIGNADASPFEFHLLGSEQHLATATAATLFLDVLDRTGTLISRDSVVVAVR